MNVTTQIETKDDNIYYNVNIVNNESFSQYANFSQRLTGQIIDNPNDYYMAVARFSLNGDEIPLFLYKPNFWYVSLTYGTYTASTSILSPVGGDGPYGPAFYTYQQFMDSINVAYDTCMTSLIVQTEVTPGNPTTSPLYGITAPFILYDNKTGICSIYGDITAYNSTLSTPIKVFMNINLFIKFTNFYISYFGEGLPTHLDAQILFVNQHGTNVVTLSSPTATYIVNSQESSKNSAMWDSHSIVFKSNTMGLRSEYTTISNATPSIGLNNQGSAGTGIPTDTLMTDFIPTFSSGEQIGWRQQLVYIPQFYRLIDLLGSQSNSVDIQIYWVDSLGNQYPFIIAPLNLASVKLVFLKKSLAKNYVKGTIPSGLKSL